jgi:hypothetical protein
VPGTTKGRYYVTPGAAKDSPAAQRPAGGTTAIIAEVRERGGRISRAALIALVREHNYDPRTVGTFHGRRLAWLRRDEATGESVLTARGEEMARQYVFAEQLAGGHTDPTHSIKGKLRAP